MNSRRRIVTALIEHGGSDQTLFKPGIAFLKLAILDVASARSVLNVSMNSTTRNQQVRIGLWKKSWTHVLRWLHSFINHPVHERDRFSPAMLKPLPLSDATRQLRSGMSAAACLLLCRFSAAGNDEGLDTLWRPAAEKRQGTKSRDVGQWRCRGRYGDLATKWGIWSLGSIDCGDRFSAKRRCMRRCERALCAWRDKICRATAGESSAPMRAWALPAGSLQECRALLQWWIGGDGIMRCRS